MEGGADLPEEDDGRRMRNRRMLPHHQEDHEDLEAVARSIQERYGRRLTDYDEETTDVEQQALLPSVRDPKLWMVKCAVCPYLFFFFFCVNVPFSCNIIGACHVFSVFSLDWSRKRNSRLPHAKVHR